MHHIRKYHEGNLRTLASRTDRKYWNSSVFTLKVVSNSDFILKLVQWWSKLKNSSALWWHDYTSLICMAFSHRDTNHEAPKTFYFCGACVWSGDAKLASGSPFPFDIVQMAFVLYVDASSTTTAMWMTLPAMISVGHMSLIYWVKHKVNTFTPYWR